MKVVYGGTFDPIHLGHLSLIQVAATQLQPSEIVILPCYQPVHKAKSLTNVEHRLKMLKLGISDLPENVANICTIDQREVRAQKALYSFDTLGSIKAEMAAKDTLVMLIGADSLTAFDSWYQWEQIAQKHHIFVVSRPGYSMASLPESVTSVLQPKLFQSAHEFIDSKEGICRFVEGQNIDVASSTLRINTLDNKNYISTSVYSYIRNNHLYNIQP